VIKIRVLNSVHLQPIASAVESLAAAMHCDPAHIQMPLSRVLVPVCSSALINYILASVAEGSSVGPPHVRGGSVASLAVKGSSPGS
jgi:hypothetical protein